MAGIAYYKVLFYTENIDLITNLKIDYVPKYKFNICNNISVLKELDLSTYNILVLDENKDDIINIVKENNTNIKIISINKCLLNYDYNLDIDISKIEDFKNSLDNLILSIYSNNKLVVNFIIDKTKKLKNNDLVIYLNFNYNDIVFDIYCDNVIDNILYRIFENLSKFNRANVSLYEVDELFDKKLDDVKKKDYFRKTVFNNLNKIFNAKLGFDFDLFKYDNGRIFLDESKVFLNNAYIMKNIKNKIKLELINKL